MRLTAFAVLLILTASAASFVSLRNDSEAAWPGINGRLVFIDTNRPGIWVMDADGTDRDQLTTSSDYNPSWSPDASKIVFARLGPGTPSQPQGVFTGEIWTMNPDGSDQQMITPGVTPSWSPDGMSIVFSHNSLIKRVPAGGGAVTTITQEAGVIDDFPIYRPGGGTIAFMRTVLGGGTGIQGPVYPDVYTMNDDGSSVNPVTDTGGYLEGAPDWSPDGSKLIFKSTGGDFYVSTFGAPTVPVALFDSQGDVLDYPAYSPDGTKIVYSKGEPQSLAESIGTQGAPAANPVLWTVNANGTNEQMIAGSPANPYETHPDWEPVSAVTPTASPTASPTATPSPTASGEPGTTTPTATAPPTATAGAAPTSPGQTAAPTDTPGPTPVIQDVVWGDDQCDEEANPVDSLVTLRFDAGLSTNTGDCPPMNHDITIVEVLPAGLGGESPEGNWGNVDCDDETNPIDSLKILRYDAGFDSEQDEPCPPIGADVRISYFP